MDNVAVLRLAASQPVHLLGDVHVAGDSHSIGAVDVQRDIDLRCGIIVYLGNDPSMRRARREPIHLLSKIKIGSDRGRARAVIVHRDRDLQCRVVVRLDSSVVQANTGQAILQSNLVEIDLLGAVRIGSNRNCIGTVDVQRSGDLLSRVGVHLGDGVACRHRAVGHQVSSLVRWPTIR